jgi:hypothetical protein
MLASITMLAAGTIAGRMAKSYRPVTTDVMIAAVGGLAFIAGEVISNVKFKKTIDDMSLEVTKTNDGKQDQAQITRLQDLKKSYEEAKKTTSTKKTMQLAAAAAFAAASATALTLAFQEDAMDATCQGAMNTAQAGLTTCIAAGDAAKLTIPAGTLIVTEGEICRACLPELTTYKAALAARDIKAKIPAPSKIKEVEGKAPEAYLATGACLAQAAIGNEVKLIAGGVNGACKPALTFKKLMETFTPNPVGASNGNTEKILNNILFGGNRAVASYEMYQSREIGFFNQTLNFLMPTAEAGWLPMLGLAGGALGSYILITGTLGTAIDTQMYVPTNRAIAFGVLGGLSYLASQASQDQIDKLDKNIAKIDQILTDLNTLQNGLKTNNVNEQQIKLAAFQANQVQDIPLSVNASVKTDCASSMGASNCTPLSSQVASMPGFSDLPDSFKSIASQSAKLGDGLSGTNSISGSTLSTASSLAGKQNAIAKLLARTQSKLNDQLESLGKPRIDFDKEQSDLLKKMNSQTAKALRSRGVSAGNFLSSIGGTPLSASAAPKIADIASAKKSFIPGGAGSAPGASSAAKDKGFELDFKEAPAGDAALAAGGASGKEGKFDIGSNDINTNSGESIFQLISNRYIKSGYPKLLDEIPVKK